MAMDKFEKSMQLLLHRGSSVLTFMAILPGELQYCPGMLGKEIYLVPLARLHSTCIILLYKYCLFPFRHDSSDYI